MNPAPETIPCSSFLKGLATIRITAMQERVLVERLERKGREILQRFYLNGKDWPETIYQTLGFCLGLKVNAEPMEQLAQSIPLKILAGLDWDFNQILALFLGQGGFLEGDLGPGGREIQRDFEFLKRKFNLQPNPLVWKKFRLRPGSFPVQRVVMFAALCRNLPEWSRFLTTAENPQDFFSMKNPRTESDKIVRFFLESAVPFPTIEPTAFLKNSLLINFFSPVLVALGLHKDEKEFLDRALEWLFALPPEPNAVTRRWKEWGVECSSSGESQALNELYQKYCTAKRCMECGLGAFVLNRIP
jgi:hypothetical protein